MLRFFRPSLKLFSGIVLLGLSIIFILIVYLHSQNENIALEAVANNYTINLSSAQRNTSILILAWTNFFELRLEDKLWEHKEANCPDYKCCITTDRNRTLEADAIVFHLLDFRWADIPMHRLPSQRYILFNLESSANRADANDDQINAIPGFFNWTASYRKDADVYWPYGIMLSVNENNGRMLHGYDNLDDKPIPVNISAVEKLTHGKSKLGLWIVSNCQTHSQREILMAALQQHISIDIYGDCSPKNQTVCPKSASDKCDKSIESIYYFYFALENSICPDYVTEKVWKRIRYFVVPIVLSRSIAADHLPNGSFIAFDDFPSIKSMADRLTYLMYNQSAYMEYFTWKTRMYSSGTFWGQKHKSLAGIGACQLCQKLQHYQTTKVYSNMHAWLHETMKCQKPNLTNLSLSSAKRNGSILILAWTNFFELKLEDKLWEHKQANCPNYKCHITTDRSLTMEADAIVFHLPDFHWADIPMRRLPNQRYILFNLESSLNRADANDGQINVIPGFFNWTATYRKDSDVYWPYGLMLSADENNGRMLHGYDNLDDKPIPVNISDVKKLVNGKSKLGLWIVSNCQTHSQRETLMADLQRYVSIDVYGNCSLENQTACSRLSADECDKTIESSHYFYFALENSICPDYVTEKVWKRIRYFIVPIVLNRSIAADHLPNGSFIAFDDFASIKSMANRLTYLRNNQSAYMEYFAWKTKMYSSGTFWGQKHKSLKSIRTCQLCQKLKSDQTAKMYSDMHAWLHEGKKCHNPNSSPEGFA